MSMTIYTLVALAAALAASVLALAREVRVRKALEKLLATILSRWSAHARTDHEQNPSPCRNPADRDHERL
jgi:hypothetical protein